MYMHMNLQQIVISCVKRWSFFWIFFGDVFFLLTRIFMWCLTKYPICWTTTHATSIFMQKATTATTTNPEKRMQITNVIYLKGLELNAHIIINIYEAYSCAPSLSLPLSRTFVAVQKATRFCIHINQFDPFNYSFGFRLLAFNSNALAVFFFFLLSSSSSCLLSIYLPVIINVINFCKRPKCFTTIFLVLSFSLYDVYLCVFQWWNAKSHPHILKWCAARKPIEVGLELLSKMAGWGSFFPGITNWNKCAMYVRYVRLLMFNEECSARVIQTTYSVRYGFECLFFYIHISVYRTPETNFNGAEAFSVACLKWWVILSLLPLVSLMDGLKSVCIEFFLRFNMRACVWRW